MAKRIVMVHGGGLKPIAPDYEALWRSALMAGLQRDSASSVAAFDTCAIDFVYYGDLTNRLLDERWDDVLDLADRRLALQALSALGKPKLFRRAHYEALPGKSPLKEFAADIAAPVTHILGLGQWAKGKVVPELGAYWQDQDGYAADINSRVASTLQTALASGDSVMIISHCLGSVAAYNVLWQLSQDSATARTNKVDMWLTLGSPLADDTVRTSLHGASTGVATRYPTNVVRWANFAAEDDFYCHDETVANDFKGMLTQKVIAEIKDHNLYNLAVRYGQSDPHHSTGYLIHPRTTQHLADFLSDD